MDNDAPDYDLETERALRLPSLQQINVMCAGMSELLLHYLLQHSGIRLRVNDAASSATFKDTDPIVPIGPAALTSLIVWAGNDLPLSSLTCDFACLTSLVTLTVAPKTRKYAHAALSPAHLAQLALLPHLQILAAPVVASTTNSDATNLAAAQIKDRRVFCALRSVRSSAGFLDVVHGARLPAVTTIEISAAHNAMMDVRVPHAPRLLTLVIRAGRTSDEQYVRFGPGFTEIRVPKLVAKGSLTHQRAPLLKNVEVVWTVEWDKNAIKLAETE
ncbi:hypothetical protein GGF32_008121 [Allomyces javanicus]|nr:hypothetical protein GGF32_008121 [Allomyces javanicus]